MKITKTNNQYYGKYFEQAVVAYINQIEPINKTGFNFSIADIITINEDAKNVANYIDGVEAQWVGNETSNQSCDLIVDGKEIELKYSKTKGTYYNTTIEYFVNKFNLISYKEFMKETGVLLYLEKFFGDKVYKNISPVSQQESKDFRHNCPSEYKELKKLESISREKYVKYIYDYFSIHPENLGIFTENMLTKNESGKHIPDRMIIYSYDKDEIIEYDKDEIFSWARGIKIFNITGKFSLNFDKFKVTIAWQNGTGLNNPTIRIFIK